MPPRANLPSVTRIILLSLIFQSILGLAIRYRHATQSSEVIIAWLVFLPSHSLYYPWTILTATLIENNLVALAIATLTLFYGGRYLERAWTSVEFTKFLLVASLIPNLVCFGLLSLLFALSGNAHWTNIPIHGTIPLQISFLVAFSQMIPAHTVTIFKGIISIRVTRLPILHVAGVSLLALTPILSVASFFLVSTGFISSWTYLRFYKRAFPDLDISQSSLRGDNSETFAFAELFPEFVKPIVSTISNKVYGILVALRICTPLALTDVSATRGELFSQRGTPGSMRTKDDRHIDMALELLKQRLHNSTAGQSKNSNIQPYTSVGPSTQNNSQSKIYEPERFRGNTSFAHERESEEDKIPQ